MNRLVIGVRARFYRDGLANLLSKHSALEVVSANADLEGAVAAVATCQPDLLLLDVGLGSASKAVSLLHLTSPRTRLVALGIRTDDGEELLSWAEAGAKGFVTCDNSMDELVHCIHSVLNGELACSPHVSAVLLRRVAQLAQAQSPAARELSCLTPRQVRILQHLRLGQSNKQIARELGIELATVKNHVHQVLQRLQIRHRREAAALPPLAEGPSPVLP